MTAEAVLLILRESLLLVLLLSAPVMAVTMAIGLVISLLQATTQIQEPTLTFIPKIVVVALAILFFGPFMLAMLTDFMSRVFSQIPSYVK